MQQHQLARHTRHRPPALHELHAAEALLVALRVTRGEEDRELADQVGVAPEDDDHLGMDLRDALPLPLVRMQDLQEVPVPLRLIDLQNRVLILVT